VKAVAKNCVLILLTFSVLFFASCAGSSEKIAAECPASEINCLSADGVTDVYQLIKNLGFNYETPDDPNWGNHHDLRHIEQVFDPFLDKHVFAMRLCHNENAIDTWVNQSERGKGPNDLQNSQKIDRQRNELKTDASSPDWGKAKKGDTVIYRWKFMLPEGLIASSGFTHIHQLKAVGGDESQPVITMTVRKRTGGNPTQEMQLIYRYATDGDSNRYLMDRIPLDDFLGEWVAVEEKVVYSDVNPSLEFNAVRMSDNKELMRWVYDPAAWNMPVPFRTYRPGNTFIRPKWGIYRAILSNGVPVVGPLRDETVLFADMEIETFRR